MKKRLYLNTLEILYRNASFKISLKKRLLKSFITNFMNNHKDKVLQISKNQKFNKLYSINKQNTRCLYNGRPRGVISKFGFSRHMFKLVSKEGRICGFKSSK